MLNKYSFTRPECWTMFRQYSNKNIRNLDYYREKFLWYVKWNWITLFQSLKVLKVAKSQKASSNRKLRICLLYLFDSEEKKSVPKLFFRKHQTEEIILVDPFKKKHLLQIRRQFSNIFFWLCWTMFRQCSNKKSVFELLL